MSCTIARRDFLKYALASAVIIPALGAAEASAADLPLLDPTDSVAQSLGFVPDASKVAANANPTFKPGQHCRVNHLTQRLDAVFTLATRFHPAAGAGHSRGVLDRPFDRGVRHSYLVQESFL
jgi:hypothetical protein